MASQEKSAPPLLVEEWIKSVRLRRPRRPKKALSLRVATLTLPREYRGNVRRTVNKDTGEIEIVVRASAVGKHAFPPDIKSVSLARRKIGVTRNDDTHGLLPDHLALTPFPAELDRKLVVRRRFGPPSEEASGKDVGQPTSIFAPDDRYSFSDTSFPWSTCGRVIVWKPGNSAGWIKFTPLKFDSSEPFGHAYASLIYSWNKADPSDNLDTTESAFDYVVCVLDSYLGNVTGWMGSRGYDTSWDGGNYWSHVGYPQDLSSGTRPAFIGYQSFRDESSASIGGRSSYRIDHEIDVIPGQSGGPYFGWWSGEPWPRVVGIQSAQNWGGPGGDNTCGGGNPLSELISYARNEMP